MPEPFRERLSVAIWMLSPMWLSAWRLRRLVRVGDISRGDYDCLYCDCCSGCECCWPIGRCHSKEIDSCPTCGEPSDQGLDCLDSHHGTGR